LPALYVIITHYSIKEALIKMAIGRKGYFIDGKHNLIPKERGKSNEEKSKDPYKNYW
jgi:hypothetical protein